MSYRVSVPVINGVVTREGCEETLKQIQRFDASRVILALGVYELDPANSREAIENLKNNCKFFHEKGYEVCAWIWTFMFRPIGENREDIHLFLPNAVVRNSQTKFLQPSPYLSMTIPAFASGAVTVGAYDTVLNSAADFSGRDREIGEME